MAAQDYQDENGGDWFEQNAPEPSYQEPQQQQTEQPSNGGGLYVAPPQDGVSTSYAQAPTVDNGSGNPSTSTDDPNANGGNNGGSYANDQNSQPVDDRADRAAALMRALGLSDPGNIQSLLSGRATWDEYEQDSRARATNYTGNRLLDSQGGNYNNDGTLTAQGIATLKAAGLNPNGTRIAGSGTGAPGFTGGGQNYGAMVGGASFGAAPAPFGETYSTLARPDYLQGEYKAPVWNETFKNPSMEDVQNEPGYALGLQEGQNALQHTAAARGSVLSGGTQKAAARYATNYAGTKYGESAGRLFDQYKQRYGQFLDSANLSGQARGVNESAYQTDSANNQSQYITRYNQYQSAIGNQRNADNDVWARTQDQIHNALTAAGLARP